ncbi:MAG: universal stress protein [Proteobacteria bacterium]|nr:universal stress protein [Pseudomonadota bacterium]
MTDPAFDQGALRKVLLATDLSARGDRALERAVAIVAARGAHLVIVHAFEEFEEDTLTYGRLPSPSWKRPADAVMTAKLRIRQGLSADLGVTIDKAAILIEEGEPAEVIERVATAEGVDIVVTGIAREGLFASRPVILGRTVEKLLRRLPMPILIVRDRARSAYHHIVVTTDFSEPSAHALQAALRLFPAQTLHLLHASDAPYSGLVSGAHRYAESFREVHAAELDTFLASIFLPEDDRRRIVPVIESGAPNSIVREYVQQRGADLVVMGTQGRGALLEVLLGSTAKSILAVLPCDALVVRGPRARAPRE